MAKYDKKLTTFDVELEGEKVSVDMGEIADLVYRSGASVDFRIDKNSIKVAQNKNNTFSVTLHCVSYATFDHYGSWDADEEYDLHRMCDAALTVLPDGTVVSATLTNVKGASIYGEQYRPHYKDINYGLKPAVMDYLSEKPQRALLVNLHKIKNPADLKLFVKFADHSLNNSTMKYKDALAIQHKLNKKVEKRLEKVEKVDKAKESPELSK